jgi:predicted ATPase
MLEIILERCKARDEGWYFPELLRIKGELLLQGADSREAGDCFRESLAIAGEQGALFWELRSALSLARQLLGEGRPEAARAVLAPPHARFPKGFDTADLVACSALLDRIGGARPEARSERDAN